MDFPTPIFIKIVKDNTRSAMMLAVIGLDAFLGKYY